MPTTLPNAPATEGSGTVLPTAPNGTEPVAATTTPALPVTAVGSGAPALDAGSDAELAEGGLTTHADAEAGRSSVIFEPLAAMSFNIRYDDGRNTTGSDAWNASSNPRRERVIAVIRKADPALLGVQEALQNQVTDLTAALPDYGFVGVGRDDGDMRGEYAGIFYRLDRWELLDSGHFWLSETPEVPGTVFAGSGSIRMATWIIAVDRAAQREVFFLNTHWDNVSQSSRQASADLIRERLAERSQGRALLVTGDLNQGEGDASVRMLLATPPDATTALFDAYRIVHPERSNDELTFHDWSGATTGSRIDFVLHDAHFSATSAEIHRDAFDGRYPSDHYAVSALLEWIER